MKISIKKIEYYLPEKIEDGSILKEDNPQWDINKIEEKTGISKRYISKKDETTFDLAFKASEKILSSEEQRNSIDALILVTQSPEFVLPASACVLQHRLKLNKNCLAFDVNQGCSGFIYGLAIGGSLVETGVASNVLLICSETYTKYIGKSDRTCRPIFSDGAAATLISKASKNNIGPFELGTDGSGAKNLIVKSKNLPLYMSGSDLFMFTLESVPKCINSILKKANKKITDINLFVFHQASKIVIDNIVRQLKLPDKKVFRNYQKIGNTVSATIPIALKDASDSGKLKNGDTILALGFGVGYSWGGCIIKWETK